MDTLASRTNMLGFSSADIAPPPTPSSVNDLAPTNTNPFAGKVFPDTHLKDVNADPLHAYVIRNNNWENYDRRNLILSGNASWRLLLAQSITPSTPLDETRTVEEGIATTETEERTFATNIGVSASVPKIGLGASISTTLTTKVGRSVSISDKESVTVKFTGKTTVPKAVLWFWELDVDYLLTGDLVTWRIDLGTGIFQLTGKNSRTVQTRDGLGRELKDGRQPRGAHRFNKQPFTSSLPVHGTIRSYA